MNYWIPSIDSCSWVAIWIVSSLSQPLENILLCLNLSMRIFSCWLGPVLELRDSGSSIFAQISMTCLIRVLLTRMLILLLFDNHWVLQSIILCRFRLNTYVFLVMWTYSWIIHASSCTVDDAWLRNSTVWGTKQLLLIFYSVLWWSRLNIWNISTIKFSLRRLRHVVIPIVHKVIDNSSILIIFARIFCGYVSIHCGCMQKTSCFV